MKVLAFYLPQFHEIPENNSWWGKGFTEWTNVLRAHPQYEGHHQPRVPTTHLGFYDLNDDEVRHKQARLAKSFGIDGWVYYYYRFGPKRLLDMPLQRHLADNTLDMPFAVCWANENWTRRWDGLENEILARQTHDAESDQMFAADLCAMVTNPRYICVSGKPLVLVYRPTLWPDINATVRFWRGYVREKTGLELFLVKCEGFDDMDPRMLGFDASYQFPPLRFSNGNEAATRVVKDKNFLGGLPAYENWLAYVKEIRPYKLFRGVMPSWDNTPRRQNKAHCFIGANPISYRDWLEAALKWTKTQLPSSEQFVFVNAWNEWAEGAVLEPCSQFGMEYLEATYAARKNVG